jgi:hypothetical protein
MTSSITSSKPAESPTKTTGASAVEVEANRRETRRMADEIVAGLNKLRQQKASGTIPNRAGKLTPPQEPTPAMMLNARERAVANHLKEHRPAMYRELVKSGHLENQARRMWADYTDQLHELTVNHKVPHDQADELVREVAFPPSDPARDLAPGGGPCRPARSRTWRQYARTATG